MLALSFYITYEELKHISCLVSLLTSYVFTLPMRNWNGAWLLGIYFRLWSFYITYEELKPVLTDLNSQVSLGFYITYEELKLRHGGNFIRLTEFLHYLWGIETKSNAFMRVVIGPVFTLPMRNWNRFIGGCTWRGVMVFTLPMRNWNPLFATGLRMSFKLFLHYLWGIETRNR